MNTGDEAQSRSTRSGHIAWVHAAAGGAGATATTAPDPLPRRAGTECQAACAGGAESARAACPTGTTSNLLTHIARGDVALALSFTAVASVLTILTYWALLIENFTRLAGRAVALNVTMLLCGFTVAWLARLSRQQPVTLGIETAIQNATLVLVIASSVLKDDAMAAPGAIYGVLVYAGGLLFAFAMRRFTAEPQASVAPTLRASA